jgi:predicted ATP-grasp superfamily ATP-dependent carboligase
VRLFIYEHLSAGGLGPAAPASLRCEGAAMLRAVSEDFARVPGVQLSSEADADAVLVIAPEFDDVLRRRSEGVLQAGKQLLGSLPEAVQLTGDKLALYRHWQVHGVRTALTVIAGPAPPDFPPPWVCKPRHGAGSQATFLVRGATEWRAAFAQARRESPHDDLLVQPYIPGRGVSVAFLLGPGPCVPLPPAAQTLSEDGRFQYQGGEVPLPLLLSERALQLARSALAGVDGLQGWAGVDLVLGAEDHAIEINPRLTTSYIGLRQLCRENLARAWLDVLGGQGVELTFREGSVRFDPFAG